MALARLLQPVPPQLLQPASGSDAASVHPCAEPHPWPLPHAPAAATVSSSSRQRANAVAGTAAAPLGPAVSTQSTPAARQQRLQRRIEQHGRRREVAAAAAAAVAEQEAARRRGVRRRAAAALLLPRGLAAALVSQAVAPQLRYMSGRELVHALGALGRLGLTADRIPRLMLVAGSAASSESSSSPASLASPAASLSLASPASAGAAASSAERGAASMEATAGVLDWRQQLLAASLAFLEPSAGAGAGIVAGGHMAAASSSVVTSATPGGSAGGPAGSEGGASPRAAVARPPLTPMQLALLLLYTARARLAPGPGWRAAYWAATAGGPPAAAAAAAALPAWRSGNGYSHSRPGSYSHSKRGSNGYSRDQAGSYSHSHSHGPGGQRAALSLMTPLALAALVEGLRSLRVVPPAWWAAAFFAATEASLPALPVSAEAVWGIPPWQWKQCWVLGVL